MAVDILSTLNKNGSGLNLTDLTTSLVTAEIQPKQKLQQKKIDAANLSISALGTVRSQMATFQSALSTLAASAVLTAKSSSSDTTLTVTDPARVQTGTHDLKVVQQAKRQVLEFSGFSGTDQVLGAGGLTLEFGSWSGASGAETFTADASKTAKTLTFAAGATVQDVADAIDALDGVTAAVVDKGDGTFSLGVVSEIGAKSAVRLTATNGLSALDTTSTNASHLIQAAQDAQITLDGITVTRATNTITDLLPGLSVTVNAASGTSGTVTIARDADTAYANLSDLVTAYNAVQKSLGAMTAKGINGATAGALAGDTAVGTLKDTLARLMGSAIAGYGNPPPRLADFGVATQLDGSLTITRSLFDAAFAAKPASYDAMFTDRLVSSTPGVTVTGTVPDGTEAGTYSFARTTNAGLGTLDGDAMLNIPLGNGTRQFVAMGSRFLGLTVTVPDGTNSADISFGRSLNGMINAAISQALADGGSLAARETKLNQTITAAKDALTALDTRSSKLTKQYNTKFTAMEQAISALKSTGTYLTNLVAQWNKSTN